MGMIRVYHEDTLDGPVPVWIVIAAAAEELDWSRTASYSASGPWLPASEDMLNDPLITVVVLKEELTVRQAGAGEFGICLPALGERVIREGGLPEQIERLLVRIDEVEEVLRLAPNHSRLGQE